MAANGNSAKFLPFEKAGNEKAALRAQHDVVDQKKICIVLIPVDHFCCYTVTENYFFVKLV
ncbi:hypothetical protein [Cytobacillus firmus]|uniref:hypothetical protein n=1 Tax=Cytobacillus firmus TaxID=1399 RepID=UPI0018CED446|nr:hypothetical protein [Cytobacillus firmus]MBG9590571.1 hypothetical protein [Cytobacillus firmus]